MAVLAACIKVKMTHYAHIMTAGFILAVTTVLTPVALASDYTEADVRGETYCYPAKDAAKVITQLAKVKDDKRNIVDVNIKPRFLIYDGGALPDNYYIQDGETKTDFTITDDGIVPDFTEKVLASSKKADLCITDKARAGLKSDDESLYFEMGLTPFFNNASGRHAIDELDEGTKDSKAHYSMMLPAAVRAFMPKTNYFHIKYENLTTEPKIFAGTTEGLKPLKGEFYNEGYVVSLEQLEAANATALVIDGGDYKLAPVPSIKTMKRFGVGRPRGPQAATVQKG